MSQDDVKVSIPVPRHREPAAAPPEASLESLDVAIDRVAWRLAVDAAGVGAFVWDLVEDRLRWDGRLLELFGLDEDTFGGNIEAFNQCVHPDDLPRVSDALEQAIATCGEYTSEYRVLLPDGSERWIEARGRALADRPPIVRLNGVGGSTRVDGGEVVPVPYQAIDDYGLARLDLEAQIIRVDGRHERIVRAVPLDDVLTGHGE